MFLTESGMPRTLVRSSWETMDLPLRLLFHPLLLLLGDRVRIKPCRVSSMDTLAFGALHVVFLHLALADAALDKVQLLFQCFLVYLPLHRIEGPLPRTAWQDGHRLVQQHAVRFSEHLVREFEGRGPDRATLSDLQKGLWSYWKPKLSNSRLRKKLWPDQGDPQDGYQENEMCWRGFHITHRELHGAILETVLRYSIARDIGLEVD